MALLNGARPHVADPFTFWAFNVVVASFAVVPGAASATSIAAGVIYGTPLGVALVGSSCAVGAGVSFIIARYAARPIVEKIFLRGDESPGDDGSAVSAYKFAALDQAVMRDGAQIVLLTRLSPLSPYVAMSFAFGLTAVDFAPYMAASAVGILPASTLYVYLGDTGRRAAGSGTGAGTSKLEMAFYAFGLAVTALVTVRITRLANDALGAKTGAGRSNQSTPREGRARRDSAAAAAAARPSAANLWGMLGFRNRVPPNARSGTTGAFGGDGDDSDFDSYYDTDEEDERAGALEMAERGGGMDVRGGDDDAPETELEVSYAAETADASGFRNGGVFLVSDPLAGPAPLGSPTPKR